MRVLLHNNYHRLHRLAATALHCETDRPAKLTLVCLCSCVYTCSAQCIIVCEFHNNCGKDCSLHCCHYTQLLLRSLVAREKYFTLEFIILHRVCIDRESIVIIYEKAPTTKLSGRKIIIDISNRII
ncbi:uncharacterized protein LOC106652051 isoform X2 [Trichogramma pretiosum]|uniref:uncharacterized protein LOC106652051 isoform X2 n=1 Tax=Trichogramma pretiosum TaxID=7493 RepID=UPI000C719208|nr:uncharacterized protein LOC106652051 isoform X2 [Trichogramma pretiosum]